MDPPAAQVRQGWLGVVGGMGPLATADFLAKLTLATPAAVDQDHIPVLLYGDCVTPDRTAAALGQGASPLPMLQQAVDFLTQQGVQAIAMPCNSAHGWYDQLVTRTERPILHIVDACVQRLQLRNPRAQRVGVLSTEGTAQMGIYSRRLARLGLAALEPTAAEFAELVSPGIAHVKAGALATAGALLQQAALRLQSRGAQAVILGCTEIPLAMAQQLRDQPSRYIDCTEALVAAVLAVMRPVAVPSRRAGLQVL